MDWMPVEVTEAVSPDAVPAGDGEPLAGDGDVDAEGNVVAESAKMLAVAFIDAEAAPELDRLTAPLAVTSATELDGEAVTDTLMLAEAGAEADTGAVPE